MIPFVLEKFTPTSSLSPAVLLLFELTKPELLVVYEGLADSLKVGKSVPGNAAAPQWSRGYRPEPGGCPSFSPRPAHPAASAGPIP